MTLIPWLANSATSQKSYPFSRICHRYVRVRAPRRRLYQRVVDVPYETVCEDGSKCTRTRQEYRTSHRTVYRTAYKCAEEEGEDIPNA